MAEPIVETMLQKYRAEDVPGVDPPFETLRVYMDGTATIAGRDGVERPHELEGDA